LFQLFFEEFGGKLGQHPRPVTGFGVGIDRSTVLKVTDTAQRFTNDSIGTLSVDIRDEPDTTRIVFVLRVIETL